MHSTHARGFTLVELLVTAAVTALVFGGITMSVQFAVKLIANAKAKTGAVSLATERLEYIRSLAYDDIGTVAGIPAGPIPQNATATLNGITYVERVLIQFIDAPEDGEGGADGNGILADYKRIKVEYSWLGHNGTTSIALLSDVAPPGIETTAGGGTLRVNVFDAGIGPVQGAGVRVRNTTTTSTIDTTQYTNAQGIALFAGAPAAADYQITVTKNNYSTDGTYAASSTNPDPVTPPVAVVEGAVSTMNFQIDQLSTLTVRTVEPATTGNFIDSFDDASLIDVANNITLVSGDAVLVGGPGAYVSAGTVFSTSTTPTGIDRWDVATWDAVVPGSGTVLVRVYAVSGGSYTLVPDTDLPGNAAGFTGGSAILTGIDVGTYPTLALGAAFTTTNATETPQLHSWSFAYTTDEPPIGAVPFILESTKIIGNTPVYKYSETHQTDGSGAVTIGDLEWDSYKVTLTGGGYDIAQACAALPFVLEPNTTDTLTLTLVPNTTRTLRVRVVNTSGNPIASADVELSRSGFSETGETSACGQRFFNTSLADETDYTVAVSASGYDSATVTNVAIHGDETLTVTLNAS